MNNKIFLENYKGYSIDELLNLEKTHRIDSIILAIETKLINREKTSETENTVLAVTALEREVNSGGFEQFFSTSSVKYAPYIVSFLKNISCFKTAKIVQKAIEILDVNFLNTKAILERLNNDNIINKLEELDKEFYTYPDCIECRLFEYIKKHKEDIQLDCQ